MAKFTTSKRRKKIADVPSKPWDGYPLFPHASGRWAKKVRGKLHYFGRWGTSLQGVVLQVDDVRSSAIAALDAYERQRDDLQAGRTPREPGDDLTIGWLCFEFLVSRKQRLASGEIVQRSDRDAGVAADDCNRCQYRSARQNTRGETNDADTDGGVHDPDTGWTGRVACDR